MFCIDISLVHPMLNVVTCNTILPDTDKVVEDNNLSSESEQCLWLEYNAFGSQIPKELDLFITVNIVSEVSWTLHFLTKALQSEIFKVKLR